jgi:hypothetical protein
VYTGNEAPIDAFYQITGWLTAKDGVGYALKAKVVFIEHRYYGESLLPETKEPF